jgi:hypothetical protein
MKKFGELAKFFKENIIIICWYVYTVLPMAYKYYPCIKNSLASNFFVSRISDHRKKVSSPNTVS